MILKFLMWRLSFDWANLKRCFGPGNGEVNYLGFGANLSSDILNQRRIRPLGSEKFTLRDHALRFDHPAAWENCSYASAEFSEGENLHGDLLTLSVRDAERMDFYENVPFINRYRRSWVEQDGTKLFFYQTNRSTQGLNPTEEYLGFIVSGLSSHPDVSKAYFNWIQNYPTAEPGQYVTTYAAPDKPGQSAIVDGYRRLSVRFCLGFIYRFSLTEWLVR